MRPRTRGNPQNTCCISQHNFATRSKNHLNRLRNTEPKVVIGRCLAISWKVLGPDEGFAFAPKRKPYMWAVAVWYCMILCCVVLYGTLVYCMVLHPSVLHCTMQLYCTLGYAIMLPGRKSSFRAGFRPHSNRESLKAGRRADVDAFPIRMRPKSGPEARFPARKHHCVTQTAALYCNVW